jgi:hypothetical protein
LTKAKARIGEGYINLTNVNFEKEGFNSGKFPLEISSRDASGGSVSYELGSAAHDTIELRDGSVLAGDLVSINGMEVEVRIGGNRQTIDRNQVKRIPLTSADLDVRFPF